MSGRGWRRRLAGAVGVTALAAAMNASAATQACWTSVEADAVAVRVLQSELTLGALVCGHQDVYAKFVQRQAPALKAHSAALIEHFRRAYGEPEGQRRLDTLATRLANEASTRKTDWTADYCAFLRALTERATATPPDKLGAFAAVHPHARRTAADGACAR